MQHEGRKATIIIINTIKTVSKEPLCYLTGENLRFHDKNYLQSRFCQIFHSDY